VVVSDMRTRGRDKTAYREWLQEGIYPSCWPASWPTPAAPRRVEISAELKDLRETRNQVLAPFYRAAQIFRLAVPGQPRCLVRARPRDHLHPDRLLFEAFSQDESSYCAVSIRHEAFEHAGERICGTTNIDYSASLYEEFQKIRSYRDTRLTLDPAAFGAGGRRSGIKGGRSTCPTAGCAASCRSPAPWPCPPPWWNCTPWTCSTSARGRARRERHGPRCASS
jgi:hypothetical protein